MDIILLRETFSRARKENGGLTALGMRFYERLFEKYPSVRHLFTTPPEEQHKKLMASVGCVIAAVQNPEDLLPYLHAMGIRHLKYKAENAHYTAVAENLVSVLGEHLSVEGQWTPAMEEAWNQALSTVSLIMIEAANDPNLYKDELLKAGYDADGFIKPGTEPWKMPNQVAT